MYIYICTYIHVYTYIHTYIHIHIYICKCMHIYIHIIHTYTYIHTYIHTHVYVCKCMHIYIHIIHEKVNTRRDEEQQQESQLCKCSLLCPLGSHIRRVRRSATRSLPSMLLRSHTHTQLTAQPVWALWGVWWRDSDRAYEARKAKRVWPLAFVASMRHRAHGHSCMQWPLRGVAWVYLPTQRSLLYPVSCSMLLHSSVTFPPKQLQHL
jgi:hypothetical protein